LAGRFTIAGTGLTVGKAVVFIRVANDEFEMEPLLVSGIVTTSTLITCYWNSYRLLTRGVKSLKYYVEA
jgi:hypothetical protein